MKHSATFLFIIICAAGASPTYCISGGQNATLGQFPFMVAFNDYNHYCNGVIVAPSWILTTAYCVLYTTPAAEVYVESNINEVNGTAYKLFEKVTYKEYDDWTLQNNIALIRINAVLEYSDTIQRIELGEAPAPNSTCTIIGWGNTEVEDFPSLQYADTTAIDLTLCQNLSDDGLNPYYLGPEQVCTLSSTGQGACYRDHGGPLVCDGKLAGVLSYTESWFECGVGKPDVFTSIANYTDWILSYIGG